MYRRSVQHTERVVIVVAGGKFTHGLGRDGAVVPPGARVCRQTGAAGHVLQAFSHGVRAHVARDPQSRLAVLTTTPTNQPVTDRVAEWL